MPMAAPAAVEFVPLCVDDIVPKPGQFDFCSHDIEIRACPRLVSCGEDLLKVFKKNQLFVKALGDLLA